MTPNGSTGPRSAEGKAASSRNALKSGIYANATLLPGEDPEERRLLIEEYYRYWIPTTPEQRVYVDTLVQAEWMLRRLRRCDDQRWVAHKDLDWFHDPEVNVGQAFSRDETTMARLQYRINAFQRSYKTALHELKRLKQEEAADDATVSAVQPAVQPEANAAQPPQPALEPAVPLTASSFRQTSPEPPAPTPPPSSLPDIPPTTGPLPGSTGIPDVQTCHDDRSSLASTPAPATLRTPSPSLASVRSMADWSGYGSLPKSPSRGNRPSSICSR